MSLCDPWDESLIQDKKKQNLDNDTKMTFCSKDVDHSQNNCEGLTQWAFVPLGPKLTYTTTNLKNFRNYHQENKYIDDDRLNHKNRHPFHNFTQTCGGSKYVCTVWIQPTDSFSTYLMTSFRIHEQ